MVDVDTGRCHRKSSHRMLPSHLGVGGNIHLLDDCILISGHFNWTVVYSIFKGFSYVSCDICIHSGGR